MNSIKLLTITALLSVSTSNAEPCYANKFVKTEGMELPNNVIKTVEKSFVELCWDECVWCPNCSSINVRRVWEIRFECDLNAANTSTEQLVPRQGSDYYEMTRPDEDICKLYSCKKPNVTSYSIPPTKAATTTPSLPTTSPTSTTPFSTDCELHFPRASTDNYIKVEPGFVKNITGELLFHAFLKVPSSYTGDLQILSYQTGDGLSSFSVVITSSPQKVGLTINGQRKDIGTRFRRDNTWQHLYLSLFKGEYSLALNKWLEGSVNGFPSNATIVSGGSLYVGHGSFNAQKVFQGVMADLRLLTHGTSSKIVNGSAAHMATFNCTTNSPFFDSKTVMPWESIIRSELNGQITKQCPATCH